MARPQFSLTLFVRSSNSGQALARLYRALEFHNYTDYELEIVDIERNPVRAASYSIETTPTLLMLADNGEAYQTSDLSDIQQVRNTFGFKCS
jgi:hypothetical protein